MSNNNNNNNCVVCGEQKTRGKKDTRDGLFYCYDCMVRPFATAQALGVEPLPDGDGYKIVACHDDPDKYARDHPNFKLIGKRQSKAAKDLIDSIIDRMEENTHINYDPNWKNRMMSGGY